MTPRGSYLHEFYLHLFSVFSLLVLISGAGLNHFFPPLPPLTIFLHFHWVTPVWAALVCFFAFFIFFSSILLFSAKPLAPHPPNSWYQPLSPFPRSILMCPRPFEKSSPLPPVHRFLPIGDNTVSFLSPFAPSTTDGS